MTPAMIAAVLATVTALLLLTAAGAGISLALRERQLARRLGRVAGLVPVAAPRRAPESWRDWGRRVGAHIAQSPLIGGAEQRKLALLLDGAGFRGKSRLANLVAAKLGSLMGALFVAILLAQLPALQLGPLFEAALFLGSGLVGWRSPDAALAVLATRRRRALERHFPEALDLLVICAEAGIGLEQALERIGGELVRTSPALATELSITSAEIRVLGDRRQALDNLGRRLGVEGLQGVITTLVQTMQYGTPLAQALRVMASELRTSRFLRLEERAARLPALMTLPMVFFILPCVFLIIVGPAMMQLVSVFAR
jgi:tight adherence protein C